MAKASDKPKAGNHVAKEWITYREALAQIRAAHVGYDDAAAHDALMRLLDTGVVHCSDANNEQLTSRSFSRWNVMQVPGQPRERARFSPFDMWNEAVAARLEQSRWSGLPGPREAARSAAAKGGRPPNKYWHVLGVEVGAWLTDEGAPHTVDSVITFISQRLADHDFDEPDAGRIRQWAERFLDAYRQYRGPPRSR